MLLDLKRIFINQEKSLSLKINVDLSDVKQNGISFFPEPVTVDVEAENRAGMVILNAEVNTSFNFVCDRCNLVSNRNFNRKFSHIIVEHISSENNGDYDYIEAPGCRLDTDSLFRDDILTELPSKLLCKDDCKGLCFKCGKNLNEGRCGCVMSEPDPRTEALRRLLS